jgi:ParB family chromosome partitioning protein
MSRPNRFKGIAGRAFEAPALQDRGVGQTVEKQKQTTDRLPGARLIPTSLLEPDGTQPRKHFAAARLDELAQSIRVHGILQPLLVTRSSTGDTFRILAG